jgi:hypothetical protein
LKETQKKSFLNNLRVSVPASRWYLPIDGRMLPTAMRSVTCAGYV